MQEILSVIVLVLFGIYIVAAWKANAYISYYMFHIEATYVSNFMYYYAKKFFMAMFLGVISIPVAAIHKLVTKN